MNESVEINSEGSQDRQGIDRTKCVDEEQNGK